MKQKQCVRCGWVEGSPPLNCNNDDTPHLFIGEAEIWKANADEEPLKDDRVWPDDFRNFGSNVFGRRFGQG